LTAHWSVATGSFERHDAFARAVADQELQLVTITGEPGIGKTRLVAEFEAALETLDQSVTRLRGRCLAYGDGIGFWPLAEAVKQHLGIDEADSEDAVRARLVAAVEGMEDAPWLRARLAPLVGLPGEAGERDEVFTAWQRFFDEVAAKTPLVLVFEDLHWAAPAMLAFVQYLAEWSSSVPVLVLCTARPELLDAHPTWASGLANATTLALRPLNPDERTRLAQTLLTEFVASAAATATLVERCGGNPLYAEEYARLLADRTADATADLVMPESVRALIGARIDSLPVERRSLLHDAAVVGKVFWAGALAAVGAHDPAAVRSDLHELVRREFVRRSRSSTLAGDDEYAFWHNLVHEVAYTHIPRAHRADLHRRVAEWIEQAAGDRVADRAELLAHHYLQALTLTRAIAHGDDEPLRKAALHHLTVATDRAMGLDPDHATRLCEQALAIAEASDRERARLLCLLGTLRMFAAEFDDARRLLGDARAAAEATGDAQVLAEAYYQEALVEHFSGDAVRLERVLGEAIRRLGQSEPTGRFALVLALAGLVKWLANDVAGSQVLLERAVAMAEAMDDRVALATAVDFRGLVRIELGDRHALDDLATAVDTFVDLGSPFVVMAKSHLGVGRVFFDGPADAAIVSEDAIATGVRTRNAALEIDARENVTPRLVEGGAWDELVAELIG
jgi:predicted ATPase